MAFWFYKNPPGELLTPDQADARFAELGARGGDAALSEIILTLRDQVGYRTELEQSLLQGRMTLWSIGAFLLLAAISPRGKLFFLAGAFITFLFSLPHVLLVLKNRQGAFHNEGDLFRLRNSALDAIVLLVRDGNLSPYAPSEDQRLLLETTMKKVRRDDLPLRKLLSLSIPSPDDYVPAGL